LNSKKVIESAIDSIYIRSQGSPLSKTASVTLNFHPDTLIDNKPLLAVLASEGVYRSQFETGTSNGSLSAHEGGRRFEWEQQLFGGAYDQAPSTLRPKYGALNYKQSEFGAAPRFGSAHFRLNCALNCRCTFAYPDSHTNPEHFGTNDRMALITLAEKNALQLEPLDNYIEAHVHGVVDIAHDVDALVLDSCYKNTPIESIAETLPCSLEWHSGYVLTDEHVDLLKAFRGETVAKFISQVLAIAPLTPARLADYRDGSVAPDILKKVWHCLALLGQGSGQGSGQGDGRGGEQGSN